MTGLRRNSVRNNEQDGLVRMHSPAVQPLLQSLLSTLANMDFEYERERQKIGETTKDANLKKRVLAKLTEQHCERREPYIQQLAILQDRIQRGWH